MINKTYTANVYKGGEIVGSYVATVKIWVSPVRVHKCFKQWAAADNVTFADFRRVR
jgi:hypothetical protein